MNTAYPHLRGALAALSLALALVCGASAAKPGAVTPISPTGIYSADHRPAFTWDTSTAGATWYQIWVARSSGWPVIVHWVQTGSWTPAVDLPAGQYSWAVQTYNADGYGPWSSVVSFTLVAQVPEAVTLNYPAAGDTTGQRPVFKWTPSPTGAAAIWYMISVTQSGALSTSGWSKTPQWIPDRELADGAYAWSVKAWNVDGFSPPSASNAFTVKAAVPSAVTLTAPADASTVTTSHPTFTWDPGTNAALWYQITLNKDGSAYTSQWVHSPHAILPLNLPSGNYTWSVLPWNTSGYRAPSVTFSFTVAVQLPGKPSGLTVTPLGRVWFPSAALGWTASNPTADWYYVQLFRNGQPFWPGWTQKNSWSPFFLPSGSYTWKVIGWSSQGFGEWSDAGPTFTVSGTTVTTP